MWWGPWVWIIKYWKEHHLFPMVELWHEVDNPLLKLWGGRASPESQLQVMLQPICWSPRRQSVGSVFLLPGSMGWWGGCSCLPWSPGTDSVYCLGLRGRQAWYQGHPQVTLWRWYSKKPVCLWGQGSLALSKRDSKLIREAELYV